MKRLFALALFAASAAAMPITAEAAPCKDAKGKFIKCPPAAPAKAVKKAPCRNAKGHFKKC
jgi:hypothetical protein